MCAKLRRAQIISVFSVCMCVCKQNAFEFWTVFSCSSYGSCRALCPTQANFAMRKMRIFLCRSLFLRLQLLSIRMGRKVHVKETTRTACLHNLRAPLAHNRSYTAPFFFCFVLCARLQRGAFFRPVMDEAIYKAQMRTRHIPLRCDSLLFTNALNKKEKREARVVGETLETALSVFTPVGVS